jgi:primosomal protein N'
LKPKESCPIELKFRPKTRLPPFEHDILLKIEGIDDPRKLLTAQGVAHGIELKIMDEFAAFGNVV